MKAIRKHLGIKLYWTGRHAIQINKSIIKSIKLMFFTYFT